MEVTRDGVSIDVLPGGARCIADEERRSPLDIIECPMGCEECSGDCDYYTED